MKLENALLIDLEYEVDKDIVFSDNISYSHIYLERYKQSKNEMTLRMINSFMEHKTGSSLYVTLPLTVNYDSIIDNMKNYHILIPEILSGKYETITDLFMLYQISKHVREEMYDEYDKVRKLFAKCLSEYIEKENNILVAALIKIAVYNRVINPIFLNHCVYSDAGLGARETRIVNKVNTQMDKLLEENGMKLISKF